METIYEVTSADGRETSVYQHRDLSFRYVRSDIPLHPEDAVEFGVDVLPGFDPSSQTGAWQKFSSRREFEMRLRSMRR